MEKKDVKVGMKVRLVDVDFEYVKANSTIVVNCFKVTAVNDFSCDLKGCGSDYECQVEYSSIELSRWEESGIKEIMNSIRDSIKEYSSGGTHQEIVYWSKVPKGVKDLVGYFCDKNDKEYKSPKELNDALYRDAKKEIESHLPITREFIESFGFVANSVDNDGNVCIWEKSINKAVKGDVIVFFERDLDGSYSLFENDSEEYIFQDFTCTTQSELRFLLTKGLIDCSK